MNRQQGGRAPGGEGGILGLRQRVDDLPEDARTRVERLFDIRLEHPQTDPPGELMPWLEERFGSVEAVRNQTVLKVTNQATLEAALFAPLRARRPLEAEGQSAEGADPEARLRAEIAVTEGDAFCTPEIGTPANVFGRVHGRHMLTGANAAAVDAQHGVIIFEAHDPLAIDATLVADLLTTGRVWAERARSDQPEAANYFLAWNCLWRAGGSIIHGHAQVLLGAGPHYARLERWRRDADSYRALTGAHLTDDLVATHHDLGLAVHASRGVTVLAHLTPAKEREVLVVGPDGTDEREPGFASAVAASLIALRDRLGVRAFNLALWRPPLTDDRSSPAGWSELPIMARIVDRGAPFQRSSDIGAMELYGTPVVSSDPYAVADALRAAIDEGISDLRH